MASKLRLSMRSALYCRLFVDSYIYINGYNSSWVDLDIHLDLFVYSLEELYLSGNDYDQVSLTLEPYTSLSLLQLTSNKLHDWHDITLIDRYFPALHSLVIADNSIAKCG